MKKRVFVIDYEILSPLGIGKELFTKNLLNNISVVGKIENFFSKGLEINIAAEIKDDLSYLYKNEDDFILEKIKIDRRLELIVSVFNLIKERFFYLQKKIEPERSGVILGVGTETSLFSFFNNYFSKINDTQINIREFTNYFNPYDIFSIYLAEKMGLGKFQQSVMTACAASNQAIGLAADFIRDDEADFAVAGGTDSIINTISFIAFEKLGTLAMPDNPIEKSCKPFDMVRSGTVAGEAAGIVLLASEKFVEENKLLPMMEIIGFGQSLDAYMITAPDPTGAGMKKAMENAIADAEILPSQIEYINAHGTGTNLNDMAEAKALSDLFGKDLKNIHVSSTKDRHGHAIAAAGIQEFAVVASAMNNNFIPHTLNLNNPIEIENFYPLKKTLTETPFEYAMLTNYGFGGVNSALILKKYKK